MMRKLFLVISLLLSCQFTDGQMTFPIIENSEIIRQDSVPAIYKLLDNLDVNQDERLEKILKWHVENNKKRDRIEGFRVEIYFSSAMNAKEQALRKKKEFLSKYPKYDVHVKYIAPNFRVRAGDFRTKSEALKLLKALQKDYPGAFIVPDNINFPLLKRP